MQVLSLAASDAPGGFRKVWVYRPAVADSADVPVVYFLHGLPGGYLDIANIGGKSLLDRLIASGTVAPFVLVVPDGNSSRAADPEWANAPARSQQLEDFVVGSLIDTVEGPDVRDREHRFLTGFSMGGYGAMNIALHHPGLYGAVASIAGYFDTDDESGIFGGDHTTLAANSPDHETAGASALQIMLADGQDDTLPVTRGETQRFAALLRDRGLTPYVDIEPGGHDSDYLAHELPRVLQFLVPPAG